MPKPSSGKRSGGGINLQKQEEKLKLQAQQFLANAQTWKSEVNFNREDKIAAELIKSGEREKLKERFDNLFDGSIKREEIRQKSMNSFEKNLKKYAENLEKYGKTTDNSTKQELKTTVQAFSNLMSELKQESVNIGMQERQLVINLREKYRKFLRKGVRINAKAK